MNYQPRLAEGEFPRLHGSARLGHLDKSPETPVYDVKFYPYTDPHVDPVFAVVAGRDVFICRPNTNPEDGRPFSVLKQIRDPDETISFNSLVWSQDITTGEPLLCVAGSGFKSIKIFSALSGELVRDVIGHGGDINDLAISPCSPQMLASCSADHQIRLWSLDSQHQKQPCAVILSGEGHTQPVLAMAFHSSGKYLLSGGQDTMICLWSLPEIPTERTGGDKPDELHYPHFVTTQVHSDYVDCIMFYGDLILSRASGGKVRRRKDTAIKPEDQFKRNDILLWKIDGFPSADHNLIAPLPDHGVHTRSAFGGGFQRLLTFELEQATPFYMRFGLFDQPGHHAILAMGNEMSKYSFWDLQCLQKGYDPKEQRAKLGKKKRKSAFNNPANLGREASIVSNASSAMQSYISEPSSVPSELKFDIADPYKTLSAHKIIVVPAKVSFACRQVAWSNCGRWCVAVGDYGMVAVFKRWGID